MNKKLSFIALSALMLTACSNDDLLPNGVGEPTDVSFSVALPEMMATRTENATVGKGYGVERLFITAFTKDKQHHVTMPALTAFSGDVTTTTQTLNLVKGETYDIVFWADSGNGTYTYNEDDGTVTIDYNKFNANDEAIDAFSFYYEDFVAGTSDTEVHLKRMLAQVNIGSTEDDFKAAKDLGVEVSNTSFEITYDTYDTLDLRTGELGGNEVKGAKVVYTSNTRPGDFLSVNSQEYHFLGSAYLPASVGGDILANVNFLYEGCTTDRNYPTIPVRRNYRTNIIGQILTNPYDFEVVLDTPFMGDTEFANVTNTIELATAIAAAQDGEILVLAPNTYQLPSSIENKNLHITAATRGLTRDAGSEVVIDMSALEKYQELNCSGTTITFDGVTIKNNDNIYKGFSHGKGFTFNNCKITDLFFLWSTAPYKFNNCVFVQDSEDYNIWSYAASTAEFTKCRFESLGKGINVYNEGGNSQVANFTNCEFVATPRYTGDYKSDGSGLNGQADKAAINIDGQYIKGDKYLEININNCTAEGFGHRTRSHSQVWNVKNLKSKTTVVNENGKKVFDGSEVYSVSEFLTMFNVSMGVNNPTENIVIDGAGRNIKVGDWADLYFKGNITIKNVTFLQGLCLSATSADAVVTLENCDFWPTNHWIFLDKHESDYKTTTERIDNSGDGLCLNIETTGYDGTEMNIKGCKFYGENDVTLPRSCAKAYNYVDFAKGLADSYSWKRGHAIAINAAAGDGVAGTNKALNIENCTIYSARGNAIQLYKQNYPCYITNTAILDWGVNAQTAFGKNDDSAIRGTMLEGGSLNLNNVTFGRAEDAYHYHVNVNNCSSNTDHTQPAGTVTSTGSYK